MVWFGSFVCFVNFVVLVVFFLFRNVMFVIVVVFVNCLFDIFLFVCGGCLVWLYGFLIMEYMCVIFFFIV